MHIATAPRPFWLRLFYLVPVIGWIARDVDKHGEDNLIWGLITIISMWGCAILLFGYPGLIIPALMLVPTIFILLIAITWGDGIG